MIRERSFPADLAKLHQILDWVRECMGEAPLAASEKMKVEVALEEAVVNIIDHGTKDAALPILLRCRYEPMKEIEFELSDRGPPFNPLTHLPPSQTALLSQQREGGVGLILIRKCMDAVLYRREHDQNILTLVKKV